MKIYTRQGDKGSTSLFSGKRISKDHPLIEALGTVDEANSALGLSLSFLPTELNFNAIRQQIESIQHALFDLGASLATPLSCHQQEKLKKTRFNEEATKLLEEWIDTLEHSLPSLKTFILPGGHPASVFLHLSRTIIRRAERLVILPYKKKEIDQAVLIYLNRLSDYLFVLARFVNHQLKIKEIDWHPSPSS